MKILFLITYSIEELISVSIALAKPLILSGIEARIITSYQELNLLNLDAEEIIQKLHDFQPDLIIYDRHGSYFLSPLVIEQIKYKKIPIIIPVWDSCFSSWIDDMEDYWLSTATYIIIVDSITNYFKYRALKSCYSNLKGVLFYGGSHVVTDIFKYEPLEKKYDIFFIGTKIGVRSRLMTYFEEVFAESNISMCNSGGFDKNKPLVYDDYVLSLNQSKICLNAETLGLNYQIKGRIFEYLACGGFCLTNYVVETERFFPENCLVMYKDFDDCVEKIFYYLEQEEERKLIAQQGYEWFHQTFNYKYFWATFLKAIADHDDRQIDLLGESTLPLKYRIG